MDKIVKGITEFLETRGVTDVEVKVHDPGVLGGRMIPFTKHLSVFFNIKEKRYTFETVWCDEYFKVDRVLPNFKANFKKIRRAKA